VTAHRSWLSLLVVAVLAVSGIEACGGPTFVIQQYGGPSRPGETIAIIRINGKDGILWASLDGEAAGARLPEDSRFHIEVLPGKHTLGIRGSPDSPTELVSFLAEPGKVYRPVLAAAGSAAYSIEPGIGGGTARMYEVDKERDTLIRDVTLTAPTTDDRARAMGAPHPAPPSPPSVAPEAQSDAGPTEPAATNAPSDGGPGLAADH